MATTANTAVNNNSKKGFFSNFKEKHPTATKVIIGTGIFVGTVVVTAGCYIFLYEPKMGNNCWRAHVRKDGTQKIGYLTAARANFQTIKDFVKRKDHDWMWAYVCPICGKFHIGHKH